MFSGAAGKIVNHTAQAPFLVPIKPKAEMTSQSLHQGEEYHSLKGNAKDVFLIFP